jgi:hypothetical protein
LLPYRWRQILAQGIRFFSDRFIKKSSPLRHMTTGLLRIYVARSESIFYPSLTM